MDQKLCFLTDHFPQCRISFSPDGEMAAILNPNSEDHCRVQFEAGDDFTPYIVCFSYQHCHLCDEEDVCDWIGEIISGKRCIIEFFSSGARCFGGDLDAAALESLDMDTLKAFAADFGMMPALKKMDAFKIRGWKPEHCIDGTIHADGGITIQSV